MSKFKTTYKTAMEALVAVTFSERSRTFMFNHDSIRLYLVV